MNKIPMTINGEKMLRQELEQLKAQRPEISKAIGIARENGDLSENADYHAARERQGLAEARIRYIEGQLSNAQVVNIQKISSKDKIVFGATVHLANIETDEELCYQIVGEDEADIKQAKISVTSPLARSLIGKKIGDYTEVKAPNNKIEYEILKIEYI
jgi:transcription elongation factor GreA